MRDRRHRPDAPQVAPPRRVVRRPRPRGRVPRARRRPHDVADIDAVVLGKAPDLFEGVMKPELYLSDALGAAGKPMFRVHTAGSVGGTTGIVAVAPRRDRPAPARARGRASRSSRRATRSSRSARGAGRRSAPAARSRPFIRALHPAHRRPRAHRVEGRGQGPAERAEEPVRAPEDRRHLDREGEGVADDVGSDALPRVVPVVGRRVRGGASPTRRAATPRRPTAARRRGSSASAVRSRAAVVPGPRPGASAGRGRLRGRRLRAGRHHRPARADRLRRALRAVLLVRADLARGARHRRARARAGR